MLANMDGKGEDPDSKSVASSTRTVETRASMPPLEWLARRSFAKLDDKHQEIPPEAHEDEELINGEADVRRVLSLLERQRKLQLTEKQAKALRDARLHQEHLFSEWRDPHSNYSEDEEERVKDFDQNHRLELLWGERRNWVNYSLAIAFHAVVITNFIYCCWESFGITIEDAKFSAIYLRDQYQCLNIVSNHDSLSHFVSIFHGLTCVAVLHAKTLQTANLCWAFICGTTIHACFKVYELLYNDRFEMDDVLRGFLYARMVQLVVIVIFQILGVIIILQRYYDLTARFQKRTHKFVTETYEGRQLNDGIIYRNVSSFVQRKSVLRSATSLQIYHVVQKREKMKKLLKKGAKVDNEKFNKDVKTAVKTLKEVEGFKGMDMMKELKRRHYENIKEEYEMGDPGTQVEEGNDERIEEILDEIKDVV